MSGFFKALDPTSTQSHIPVRSTGKVCNPSVLSQDMDDLTVDTVLSILWHQDLSSFEGICETFNLLYGDHFDHDALGFGRKGLLDFTVLPLLSRKLRANLDLEEYKNAYVYKTIAWTMIVPIETVRITTAFVLTVAVLPIVYAVTFFRFLWNQCSLKDDDSEFDMSQTMAAFYEITRYLDEVGLRTKENVNHFLRHKDSLRLVHVLQRLAHTFDESGCSILDQNLLQWVMTKETELTKKEMMDTLELYFPLGKDLNKEILEQLLQGNKLPFVEKQRVDFTQKCSVATRNYIAQNPQSSRAYNALTPSLAFLTLPSVIRTCLRKHFKSNTAYPITQHVFYQHWQNIEKKVIEEMQSKFDPLYPAIQKEGKQLPNPTLRGLVTNGKYLDMPDLVAREDLLIPQTSITYSRFVL